MLRRDGTGYPGSNLYRVLTGSTGQMIGLVNYAIRIDQLIFSAIPGLAANGIYASVFDLDAPNIDSGYIVNTQLLNGTIMTAQQNNDTLENAAYTTEDTFYFVDRNYKIVLYPSQQFENKHAPYNLKWFALGGSWLSTAFLLGLVSILQLSLRVAHAKKLQREATLQKLVQVKENQKSLRSLLNKIATQEWTTRATINAIDDIVIVIGNTGKVLQSNTYFDRIFKFTEQEFERGVYVKNLFTKLPEQFYNVSDGTPIDTTIKLRFGNEEPIEITVKSLSSEAIMAQDIDSELDDEGEDTKSFVIVGHLKRKLNANKRKSLAIPMLEFDRNFKSEKFRIELLEFSKDSKNEENVLFLMRVLTYKKLNFHQRVELSKSICEMFLLEGAPRQLNLSGETREEELKKINKKVGDIDAFSVIEEIVKKVLLEDVYVNFMEKRKENLSPNGTNQTLTSTGSDEISSLETHDGVQI
jgi:PAS domain-containing protein